MVTERLLRIGLIGAGGAAGQHIRALRSLPDNEIVGIAARSSERAAARVGAGEQTADAPAVYTDAAPMLDEQQPDAVFVCLPPNVSGAACDLLIERGLPFLVEKPLAADGEIPARLAAAIERRGIVAAVGYDWRGLDFLPEIRRAFADRPPRLVVARWLGDLPSPSWWRHVAEGGGQVVEQATHVYDFARLLLGEANVVSARAAIQERQGYPDADVATVGAALLEFDLGAIGVFANTSLLAMSVVEMEFISEGLLTPVRLRGDWPEVAWTLTFEDGGTMRVVENHRNPWAVQAEAFLGAVRKGDPTAVLSSYADALRTDRLTRAVVAASGSRG